MPAVTVAQFFIIYMNGKPCVVSPGASEDKVLEEWRNAYLGTKVTLEVKSIYDAPVDDVVRVGVISIATQVNGVANMVAAIAERLQQRGQGGLLRH